MCRLVQPGIPLTKNTLAEEPALRLLSEYICGKRKEARILREVKSGPQILSNKDKLQMNGELVSKETVLLHEREWGWGRREALRNVSQDWLRMYTNNSNNGP